MIRFKVSATLPGIWNLVSFLTRRSHWRCRCRRRWSRRRRADPPNPCPWFESTRRRRSSTSCSTKPTFRGKTTRKLEPKVPNWNARMLLNCQFRQGLLGGLVLFNSALCQLVPWQLFPRQLVPTNVSLLETDDNSSPSWKEVKWRSVFSS